MKLPYGLPDQALYIGGAVLISWLVSALWAIRMRRRYRTALAAERLVRQQAEEREKQATQRARARAEQTLPVVQAPATPANPEAPVRTIRVKSLPKKKVEPSKPPPKKRKGRRTRFDRINDSED